MNLNGFISFPPFYSDLYMQTIPMRVNKLFCWDGYRGKPGGSTKQVGHTTRTNHPPERSLSLNHRSGKTVRPPGRAAGSGAGSRRRYVCNLSVRPVKFEDQDYRKVFFMLNTSDDIEARVPSHRCRDLAANEMIPIRKVNQKMSKGRIKFKIFSLLVLISSIRHLLCSGIRAVYMECQ